MSEEKELETRKTMQKPTFYLEKWAVTAYPIFVRWLTNVHFKDEHNIPMCSVCGKWHDYFSNEKVSAGEGRNVPSTVRVNNVSKTERGWITFL